MHSDANKPKHWSLEQRKFIAESCKKMGGSCPQSPKLSKGFQQSTFKGKVRKGCG